MHSIIVIVFVAAAVVVFQYKYQTTQYPQSQIIFLKAEKGNETVT